MAAAVSCLLSGFCENCPESPETIDDAGLCYTSPCCRDLSKRSLVVDGGIVTFDAIDIFLRNYGPMWYQYAAESCKLETHPGTASMCWSDSSRMLRAFDWRGSLWGPYRGAIKYYRESDDQALIRAAGSVAGTLHCIRSCSGCVMAYCTFLGRFSERVVENNKSKKGGGYYWRRR